MAQDEDTQPDEQVSREAQHILNEYFRIRREYNSLNKTDPAHAPRRAHLKERYFALDRKYTELIRTQQSFDTPPEQRLRPRADVLWEGAFAEEDPAGRDMDPVDVQWIEMNTPTEGRAADEVFEEALRTLGPDGQRIEESAEADSAEQDQEIQVDEEPEEVDDDAPVSDDDEVVAMVDESELPAGDVAPELNEDEAKAAPERVYSLGDLDRPNMSAVSALRDIAAGFQQDEPVTPMIDAMTETPPEALPIPPRLSVAPPPVSRHGSNARGDFKSRKRVKKGSEREIPCPSCGEVLPAGTKECTYCHARLMEGETSDGDTARHITQTNLQPPTIREKTGIGPKIVITLGWLIVLIGATWLIFRRMGVAQPEIDGWLETAQLSFLGREQAAMILGVSLVLFGVTIVGIGIFAGRFVRLVVPMHELARSGRVDTIEKLILQGEDIDPRDERGCTPLHFAVVARQREVVAVLVGNGADPNSHNDRGDTPLHLATANRDTPLVHYLLTKGADASALNDSGSSLLHVAAWVGDVGLLKTFLERGLKIDSVTKAGFTPLHFAAQSGYDDAAAILLEQGADPDAHSRLGTTPLFAAVRNGHLPVVKRLVDAGADVNLRRGHDQETPLGIAVAHQRSEIAEFLRAHGAIEA